MHTLVRSPPLFPFDNAPHVSMLENLSHLCHQKKWLDSKTIYKWVPYIDLNVVCTIGYKITSVWSIDSDTFPTKNNEVSFFKIPLVFIFLIPLWFCPHATIDIIKDNSYPYQSWINKCHLFVILVTRYFICDFLVKTGGGGGGGGAIIAVKKKRKKKQGAHASNREDKIFLCIKWNEFPI